MTPIEPNETHNQLKFKSYFNQILEFQRKEI